MRPLTRGKIRLGRSQGNEGMCDLPTYANFHIVSACFLHQDSVDTSLINDAIVFSQDFDFKR